MQTKITEKDDDTIKMIRKRGYLVNEIDEVDKYIGIIATSAREAKSIAYHQNLLMCDWIDMRVRWIKDADVEDLDIGIISDYKLALKCGLFGCVEDECDMCGREDILTWIDGKALCFECGEKTHKREEDIS